MKIVIISPFQKQLARGIERFVHSISNEFAELGHEVCIYNWKAKNAFDWGQNHSNIKFYEIKTFRYFRRFWVRFNYNYLLRKHKPDVVLLNFLYHGEQYLDTKLNYIYVLHSPATQIPERYKFIQKVISKFKSLRFVAVSDKVLDEAQPFLNNFSITRIYNGVDINKFKPLNKIKPITDNQLKMVTASALEERKGIQHFIRALSNYENQNFVYHIYGDGPYLKELNVQIKNFKLEHKIIINKPVNNIHEVLPQYDLFVLLSKGEAFPIAPLEAMASGLPLIVSNYTPYPEFIESSFGYMVDPLNEKEIHQILNKICSNRNLFEELKAGSRKASKNFAWGIVSKKYINLFEKTLLLKNLENDN